MAAHLQRDDDTDAPRSLSDATTTALHAALVNDAADPLIVVDGQQRIVVFNEAAEKVFGYGSDEILGEELNRLLPEKHHSSHPGRIKQFSAKGNHHHMAASGRSRVEGRRADGSAFPAEVSLSSIQVDGQVLHAAALRDVSQRAAAERALAESERRFRASFEASPVSMVLVTAGGEFIAGNESFTEETGYTIEDLAGKWMGLLISEDDRSRLAECLAPVLSGARDSCRVELNYVRRDGDVRTVDLFLAPISDITAEPCIMIGQAVDVTDRIEAYSRLEGIVRSKDELIASISHELRTPLTALIGFSQLLNEDESVVPASEKTEMVDSIVEASMDLKNIVDDLLVAAKARTDSLELHIVDLDLRAQVAQIVEMWNRPGNDPIEVIGPTLHAQGDPVRVRQILRNLVSNALRYGIRPITVELSDSPAGAVVAVKDRGEPIPESDRARIFEPYERAHRVKGVTASMGLGLSISRRLAVLMDGALDYRRVDDGNVFELTLPQVEE